MQPVCYLIRFMRRSLMSYGENWVWLRAPVDTCPSVKDDATDRENRHDSRVYFLASRAVNEVIRVVRKSTSFRVSSKQYIALHNPLRLRICPIDRLRSGNDRILKIILRNERISIERFNATFGPAYSARTHNAHRNKEALPLPRGSAASSGERSLLVAVRKKEKEVTHCVQ